MAGQRKDAHLRRRALLRSVCASALVGLAGCPGDGSRGIPTGESGPVDGTAAPSGRTDGVRAPSGPDSEYSDRFESVVDVVAAGGDPGGERPINDVVSQHAAADTLFVFPDGTYTLEPLDLSVPANVGFVAARDADPAIRPVGVSPTGEWFSFADAEEFVLDGVDFDYRGVGQTGGTAVYGPGPIEIRDVRVRGAFDTADEQLLQVAVTDPEGTGVIEGLVAQGVDEPNVDTTGIYVGKNHAGDLTIRDCRLALFSDNAIYASPPGGEGGDVEGADGAVHVRGGRFQNNNIASIRLGSTGSTVEGVLVEVDRVPPAIDGDSRNARGIRLRGRRDQRVEDCRLVYGPGAGNATGAITLHGANGAATIRNVDIEMDRDGVPAIQAKTPEVEGDVAPTVENVTVSGTAALGRTISVTGRPGASFRNCCIRQDGDDRDGIELVDSPDCVVDRSQIDVSGTPVVLRNSSLSSEYRPAEVCPE